MEEFKGLSAVYAKDRKAWRSWLQKNHKSVTATWLIIYHKSSETPSIYYDEAVEEALCFGWIDSTAMKRNPESKYQYFTQRNLKSNWSQLNKARVKKLIDQGLMTSFGMEYIVHAKKTGTWDALNDAINAVLPEDLQKLFNKNKTANNNFNKFSKSSKRLILEWILNAKKPETRLKRIQETVHLATQNIKANHPKQ